MGSGRAASRACLRPCPCLVCVPDPERATFPEAVFFLFSRVCVSACAPQSWICTRRHRGSDCLWIEQHDFDSGEALAHGVAQFLGVEVGQAAVEKEHLPEAALQMDQGFGSSRGLFEAAGGRTQTFEHALAHTLDWGWPLGRG